MELEEIIKPYTLAPEEAKRKGTDTAQSAAGGAKRQHTESSGAASFSASATETGGGTAGKISLENLPDEIDAEDVEKILEQADEVRVTLNKI